MGDPPPAQYAEEAERYQDRIGNLEFASIQDWMCEPFMLAKTGKSIREHQELSIQSWLTLKSLAPGVPWAPVLQGWELDDYLSHAEQYAAAGVDLTRCETVGVGSVCRRQATEEAEDIFAALARRGLRLHGFGLKVLGLAKCSQLLLSADSLAWSYRARRSKPLPGCEHKSCANCLRFAVAWREKVLLAASRPRQRRVFDLIH